MVYLLKVQSKLNSFIEAWVNILIGFAINLFLQIVVFKFLGIDADISQNLQIAIIFTVVSLTRSYVIRRWFNKHTAKGV